MTINEFMDIVDPSKTIIVNMYNTDTSEITKVADTFIAGDIPFDVLMKEITFLTTSKDRIVIEFCK